MNPKPSHQVKIPLNSIAVLHRQRKELDKKKLEELATSIRNNGLLHPIVIREPFEDEIPQLSESQKYVLAVGGRRLAAHILLGQDFIEATLKESLDPLSAEIVELEENIARHDLSWQEQLAARERIHNIRKAQDPNHPAYKTAEEIGVNPGQLTKDLALAEAIRKDPSLKSATSKGSALRMAEHKAHVDKRAAVALKAAGSDLARKLFTADGRTFIRGLPSQSVDLVFSDLPYGFDYFEGAKSGENMKGQYDDSIGTARDFIADVVPEMVRVVKPTGWIVLFMGYELHGWNKQRLAGTKPLP